MNPQTLVDLYRHMEWADAAVWRAALECDQAKTDAKLRDYLYHVHVVQRAFLRTWRGEEIAAPFPTFDDLEELAAWGRSYYPEAHDHLATLTDEDLARPMPLAWAERITKLLGQSPAETTLGDTVLQVAMHTAYHRGQANARLRQLEGTPPLVDYIAWVWFGRPAADWP